VKALDTNVLVRFLVGDDARQTACAKALVEKAENQGDALLIPSPTLVETIWVLQSSYGCSRSAILNALERLTLMPVLRFESFETVRALISHGRSSRLGLTDLLIGLHGREAGGEVTVTFDKKAAKSELFELLQ